MDLGIAVDLAGRGLQHLRPASLGHAQHVDRPHHRGLHGLDGVVLVMARRGGTGQIVDLVDLQEDRQRNVVADQLEVGAAEQVGDVRLLAGEEVVQADDVVPALEQPLAEMGAEKAGPAGDQNPFDGRHVSDSWSQGMLSNPTTHVPMPAMPTSIGQCDVTRRVSLTMRQPITPIAECDGRTVG